MPDNEYANDAGETIREDEAGNCYLVRDCSPVRDRLADVEEDKRAASAELKARQAARLEQKRARQAAGPAIPREKTIL
jgi:hypothetical protein